MKSTSNAPTAKKQSVVLKDLKARKNPKGGFNGTTTILTKTSGASPPPGECNSVLQGVSTTR